MSRQATVNPFFTPTQISGCGLWLDATDSGTILLSGSSVTQWNDKSGNGRNAVATVSNASYAANSLRFTASQVYSFNNFSFAVSSYFTFFIVEKIQTNTSAGEMIMLGTDSFGPTNGAPALRYQGPDNSVTNASAIRFGFWGNDLDATNIPAFTTASAQPIRIWGFVFTQSFRGIYLNGTRMASDANNTQLSQWATPLLGSGYGGVNRKYNGFMYEIIGYGGQLSTAQRQQVEGYLAWKWGLQGSLPASHPYKTTPIPPLLNPPTTLPVSLQNTAASFLPTQISGCSLWLDAADSATLSLSGSIITQWRDKSTGNNNPTLVGSPTYASNIYPYVGTRNLTQYLTVSSAAYTVTASQPGCLFLIYADTQTQGSNYSALFGSASPFDYFNQSLVRPDGFSYSFCSSSPNTNVAGIMNTTNLILYCLQYTRGSTTCLLRLNGLSLITTNANALAPSGSLTLSGTGWGDKGNINLCEVLSFKSLVSFTQLQQVEGYLAWKWGLQANLPATHPYKTGPPYSTTITAPSRSLAISSSWQPNQISGLALWLDAADASTLSLSGTTVTQWRDKSGNNANATPISTGPQYQTNIQNKLPGLFFNGDTNIMNAGNIATGTVLSLFVALRYTNISTDTISVGFWKLEYSSALLLSGRTSTPYYTIWAGINTSGNYANTFGLNQLMDTNPHIKSADVTSDAVSSSGSLVAAIDGSASTYTNSTGPNTTACAKPFSIGGLSETGANKYGMVGYIHEIVFYRNNLTTAQRQQVEGYLAWKWGLQANLPATHPYKKWAPSP